MKARESDIRARVSDEMKEQLRQLAAERQETESVVIREIIRLYFENLKESDGPKKPRKSAKVEGPSKN